MRGQLLAKSSVAGRQITLSEHAATVRAAARFLFGTAERPTRLGREWARFFRLPPEHIAAFLLNLDVTGLLHDLGKATDVFQGALDQRAEQVIRHEHLAGLLLFLEPVYQWLKGHEVSGLDAEIILAATLSHHLKANHEEFAKRLGEGHPRFTVFTSAPGFLACLGLASQCMQTPPPDLSQYDRPWAFDEDVEPIKGEFKRAAYRFKNILRHDEHRRRLLVAVKATLIAADSVGSAMVREGQALPGWIDACFDGPPLTPAWVEAKIIQPRMREIEQRSGRAFAWHDFQTATANLGERVLLPSGCGTGKTLAAWNWISSQLQRRPASRVLFLYPTRGTATEGFRDSVSWAGGEEAALLHGTAAYDLPGMFENPGDSRRGGDYPVQERLFALGYWPKRVFSATVDSFLAFMRNQYASLCLLPVLADSAVVVDVVHSFDQAMFTALERCLRFFELPLLCMTASLPADRLQTLRETCGLTVFPERPEAFEDLKIQSEAPRYRLSKIQEGQALEVARQAATAGKRVLWVTNTVHRCQMHARSLSASLPVGTKLLCYHSRSRLSERRSRHNEVIRGFKDGSAPVVGVTTQVKAPYAAFRTFTAGAYRPTAAFITPSAAYGLILHVAGIESRYDDGQAPMTLMRPDLPRVEIAPGAITFPEVQRAYQQLHNYPVGAAGKEHAAACKGSKDNIQLVWREFLAGIDAYICLRGNDTLEEHVRAGLRGGSTSTEGRPRYGVPFLGDNNFMIELLREEPSPGPAHWFERLRADDSSPREGRCRLSVGIDRADMTHSLTCLYAPSTVPAAVVPEEGWTSIDPPTEDARSTGGQVDP